MDAGIAGDMKNRNSQPISRFMSEMIQDRAVGTMEMIPMFWSGTILNDLEWPLTQILRSCHETRSQKNVSGGSASDTDASNCHPLPRWGSGGITLEKIWNFVCKIVKFCAYVRGTAVCHWQRLTKCCEYMVTWNFVGGYTAEYLRNGTRCIVTMEY